MGVMGPRKRNLNRGSEGGTRTVKFYGWEEERPGGRGGGRDASRGRGTHLFSRSNTSPKIEPEKMVTPLAMRGPANLWTPKRGWRETGEGRARREENKKGRGERRCQSEGMKIRGEGEERRDALARRATPLTNFGKKQRRKGGDGELDAFLLLIGGSALSLAIVPFPAVITP